MNICREVKRCTLTAFIGVALVAGLVACGSSSEGRSGDGSGDGGTKSMTVGIAVPTSDYAPIYLAMDKGLFKQEGVDVKLVTFTGGADLVKGVISGSVDVGIGGLPIALSAIQQGRPLKVFYGGFNMTEFDWYGSPDIKTVADAKGKAWGISKSGSETDFLTRYLLRQNGLNPDTDVKLVQGGASAGRLAAQKAGQLQVNILTPPEKFQAEEMGLNLIASQSKLMHGYPFHVEFADASFLEENPETAEGFLRGFVKGVELTKSDPKAAQASFVEHVKIDPKYAQATYDDWIDQLYADGRLPDAKAMDTFWKIALSNGELKERIPDSTWLDTKWISSYPEWTK